MGLDLVLKNARIVDGSGMPAYNGDVGVKDGVIAEVGRVDAPAQRTLDADGMAVAPGFIDIHTHFDAQATWDPLCTFSCYHGVTTVIFGNCSLGLAPVGAGEGEPYWLSQMLANVEAIPIDDLVAGVNWSWHSMGEYMDTLDRRLGINVGCLIGHSAIRRHVMGEASQQQQHASDTEIAAMQRLVSEGMASGALGMSFSRSESHRDLAGRPDPAAMASTEELMALAKAVGEFGTGCLQVSNGSAHEMSDQLCTKLFQASGRPVTYNAINHFWNAPDLWREQLDQVTETFRQGNRAYPQTNTRPADQHFTFKNCPLFRFFPDWDEVMAGTTEEKLKAFRDPATREALRASISGKLTEKTFFNRRWDLMMVNQPALERNAALKGKSVEEIARQRGIDPFDAFLDLAIEEDLNTWFVATRVMGGGDEQTELLNSPYTVLGLSDAGAHITYDPGYGATTFLLSHWVRERGALSLEEAVRKVTFVPACIYGMYDRGLLRPGLAADMVVFDPDTIDLEDVEEVHDLPAGGARLKQLARGIEWTIVNGQVLIERGEHTGAYPGKVARNRFHAASLMS